MDVVTHPLPLPPQLSAEDYFMEAEVAYFSDDIEGARAAFKQALELEPEVSRGCGWPLQVLPRPI